jgi:hypothetical protein
MRTAQEMSLTSLGLQVSFFFLLHFVFVLLTNILGTSYLQGQQNKEEHSNTAPTGNSNSERQQGGSRTRWRPPPPRFPAPPNTAMSNCLQGGRDEDEKDKDEGDGRDNDTTTEEDNEERRTRKDNEGLTMKGGGGQGR